MKLEILWVIPMDEIQRLFFFLFFVWKSCAQDLAGTSHVINAHSDTGDWE